MPDWDFSFIQLAYHLEPDHLDPQILTGCCPYARPTSFREKMEETIKRGWLQAKEGGFQLTFGGREIAQGITELSDRLFARIEALPPPQMERLLTLLNKVAAKIKTLPEPEEKPAFELSLCFERGASAPILAHLRRRIIDLLAFHDDAYFAAHSLYENSGLLWETFIFVGRGKANNAADIATQLSYRNYAKSDYAAALEELAARGWITQLDGDYVVQDQAAQMRQEVEDTTDHFFDAAFADLNTAEMAEFRRLMDEFVNKLEIEN